MNKLIRFFIAGNFFFFFFGINLYAQSNISDKNTSDIYRPFYHFTTDFNWINDPNGLFFFNKKYHLFCQYNPFGNKWGHMSWAHAVSTDLLAWKQLSLALPETRNEDSSVNMIFSGSAVVDSFNTTGFAQQKGQVPLVAIYTCNVARHDSGLSQKQNIAYSLDEGNTWKQYEKNPVLDIGLKDFRDPKVFWYRPEKKWIMIISKATEYKVQFYESPDLKKWKFLSEFGNTGNVDRVWECPDIFQLRIEGTNEKKWVLTLSAGHPQKGFLAMQYFVGNFDGKKFIPDALHYPLYIDYGKDFYAGITYNNIPVSDGRTIMIGWANCWNYANDIPTGNVWRGLYAVPRKLSLINTPQGCKLKQQPVSELDAVEKNLYSNDFVSLKNENKLLDSAKGTSLDISFYLQTDKNTAAGINFFKNGNEETTLFYDNHSKMIVLDRTNSGNTSFNKFFPGKDSVVLNSSTGKIKCRILIDKCIAEVFINDDEYALTDLIFPSKGNNEIELFSKNGQSIFSEVVIKKVSKTLH